jgi:hypothetical protein
MAGDYGYWLDDMSPGRSGPSTFGTLVFLAIAALVLLALLSGPQATAEGGGSGGDSPACAELVRLERHGATGPSYDRAWRACRDASAVR